MNNLFDEVLDPFVPQADPPDVVKKKNYVVIALDKSGSMISMKEEAIGFFNAQVLEARNASVEMENRICLITFSDTAKIEMWDVKADKVAMLDKSSYQPEGWTAMLDAIGMGITGLMKQDDINDENVSVLFITISDGQENHSREYNYKSIADWIATVDKTDRWTFVYLGANQDLSVIKAMGIAESNIMQYDATRDGMVGATWTNSVASKSYFGARMCGMTNTKNFYEDPTLTAGVSGGIAGGTTGTLNTNDAKPTRTNKRAKKTS